MCSVEKNKIDDLDINIQINQEHSIFTSKYALHF